MHRNSISQELQNADTPDLSPSISSAAITTIDPDNDATNNVNLILGDIDGCFYNSRGDGFWNTTPIETLLFEINETFFNEQLKRIEQEGFDEVIFGPGTNRQTPAIDDGNSARSTTCLPVLPLLQNFFGNRLSANVVIETFHMPDIYGNARARNIKFAGDTYRGMLRLKYGTPLLNDENAECAFDLNKILLIYTHAQRVKILRGKSNTIIDFIDDKDTILNAVFNFFNNYDKEHLLLPKNITLRLNKYINGVHDKSFTRSIKGNGEVDTHYDWSVRYLAARCQTRVNISTGDLEFHHNNNLYDFGTEMDACEEALCKDLIAFRNTSKSLLTPNTNITQKHTYTTAAELYEQGLLPHQYAMSEKCKTHVDLSRNIGKHTPEAFLYIRKCFLRYSKANAGNEVFAAFTRTFSNRRNRHGAAVANLLLKPEYAIFDAATLKQFLAEMKGKINLNNLNYNGDLCAILYIIRRLTDINFNGIQATIPAEKLSSSNTPSGRND